MVIKILILLAILLVAYSAFSYLRIRHYATNSPNPDIIQTSFTQGSGPALKYIAAGDSTAVGEGASVVENTYTVKIANELIKTNTVEYKNIAVRGAKTSDVINNQLQQIVEFQPNVITISIGANDATHLVASKQVFANYQTIIQKLTSETKAKIYITNIANFTGAKLLPWPVIKLYEYNSAKLNPKLLALETDRVKIVNIHDFGWDKFPDRSVTYSLDLFHPSDAGYQNWADAFLFKMH